MMSFGLLGLLSSALQITVPSYALRLVRHYGTRRVGWFVVMAFGMLALLHFFQPTGLVTGSGIKNDIIFIFSSALLVVGMMHIERLWAERLDAESKSQTLLSACARRVEQTCADLTKTNQELVAQLSEQKQQNEALRAWGEQYRFLFDASPLPMCIFDLRTFEFLAVNQAAARFWGYRHDELGGLSLRQLLFPEDDSALHQLVAHPCTAPESHTEWNMHRKDQSIAEVKITMLDLRFADRPARLTVFESAEEQRRRERQIATVERAQGIEQVALGVAEHFSSLISTIDGRAGRLVNQPNDQKATEWLDELATASTRAAALTRQLLASMRRDVISREAVYLDRFIHSLYKMLQQLLGPSVMLRTSFDPGAPPVLADQRVIQQIVVSLLLNARDAMPTGGNVLVSTCSVQVGPDRLPRTDLAAGAYVRLSVRDTGSGMSPEVQARLFEPFFTTKRRALGLSLASAHGYITQHQGWIECHSQPGTGTEFHIFLPAVAETRPPRWGG